ncbi:MAG: hypothetical protein XD93_0483 [candidate division WS6 bacterium 34_10]|uniref:Uncharacterized protein n=1 Tax=candidate division WS6 bacterium 34_10 TaxID=1641389 RepID=A0A117M076_9BACT|nr:MAG: hypothetical protein XD93_0483 [candidate division WS6 bacterium 34_10]
MKEVNQIRVVEKEYGNLIRLALYTHYDSFYIDHTYRKYSDIEKDLAMKYISQDIKELVMNNILEGKQVLVSFEKEE